MFINMVRISGVNIEVNRYFDNLGMCGFKVCSKKDDGYNYFESNIYVGLYV